MNYKVKAEYLGKVKLENALGATLLDANTPQDVLATLYGTEIGKGYIDQVATSVAPQPKDNAKAGQ